MFLFEHSESVVNLCKSMKNSKGVLVLEKCLDYFAITGRSCENLKVFIQAQKALATKIKKPVCSVVRLNHFWKAARIFSPVSHLSGKIKTSSCKRKINHTRF